MIVTVKFTCDDELRRAVRHHYGSDGKATWEEMRQHFKMYGESASQDFIDELAEDAEGEQ